MAASFSRGAGYPISTTSGDATDVSPGLRGNREHPEGPTGSDRVGMSHGSRVYSLATPACTAIHTGESTIGEGEP